MALRLKIHGNGSKPIYTSYKADLPSLWLTGMVISASPPCFSMVTVTVSTAYSKYVNFKGKKKDCNNQECRSLTWKQYVWTYIPLFCTLRRSTRQNPVKVWKGNMYRQNKKPTKIFQKCWVSFTPSTVMRIKTEISPSGSTICTKPKKKKS